MFKHVGSQGNTKKGRISLEMTMLIPVLFVSDGYGKFCVNLLKIAEK